MECIFLEEVGLLRTSGISLISNFEADGRWLIQYYMHRQFMHDEQRYPGPEKFDPNRYSQTLDEDGCDPLTVVFGFGRR